MRAELRNKLNLARGVARQMENAAEFPDMEAAAQFAAELKRLATELEQELRARRKPVSRKASGAEKEAPASGFLAHSPAGSRSHA